MKFYLVDFFNLCNKSNELLNEEVCQKGNNELDTR